MVNSSRSRRLSVALSEAALCFQQAFAQPQRDPILAYIKKTWAVLTRSNHTLATAAFDPKFHPSADGRWPVYVSRNEDLRRIGQQLRDGEIDLAKDMADNFLYEIREYGEILNANRTYYLSRSQPPVLTEMLLGV